MTLTEFLLARIAEDEATADDLHERDCASVQDGSMWGPCDCGYPARVLAECEAKRQLVEGFSAWGSDAEWTFGIMALPYADHPDYRDEWRP